MAFADTNVNSDQRIYQVNVVAKPNTHQIPVNPGENPGTASAGDNIVTKDPLRNVKRVRRSAEEARRLILDAAEDLLHAHDRTSPVKCKSVLVGVGTGVL